jgi:transcriptional regulator with XRE-family HTH domain
MARPKKGQPQETDSPFKKLRLAAGLSQEDLVRVTGISGSSISRWERGLAEPTMTVYQMKAFCKAVNKSRTITEPTRGLGVVRPRARRASSMHRCIMARSKGVH